MPLHKHHSLPADSFLPEVLVTLLEVYCKIKIHTEKDKKDDHRYEKTLC